MDCLKINKSILIGAFLAVLYDIYFAWSLYDFTKPPPGYNHSMASGDIFLLSIVLFPIIYFVLLIILFLFVSLLSLLPLSSMIMLKQKLKESDAVAKFIGPSVLIQILGEVFILFFIH